MTRHMTFPAALATLLLPCVAHAATVKVEVTRFHILTPPVPPLAGSSIRLEPADPAAESSLQFGVLSAAANTELAKVGFKMAAGGQPADYVTRIMLTGNSEVVRKRSPISIGIGGGTGGWGGGIGGGVTFPVGGAPRTVTAALMTLQIRRTSDGTAVWEGRASAIAPSIDPMSAAPMLLQALFNGFPGPSGQSVTVKVKIEQ